MYNPLDLLVLLNLNNEVLEPPVLLLLPSQLSLYTPVDALKLNFENTVLESVGHYAAGDAFIEVFEDFVTLSVFFTEKLILFI